MLVEDTGRFVSQREIPEMAMLGTAIAPPYLSVFWKKKPSEYIHVPLDISRHELQEIKVQIWDDQCAGLVLPDPVNRWFSDQLGQSLRLVYMPDSADRVADIRYAPPGHSVSYADGFPYLIIGQASLEELNSRLEQALPMNRFRPNFVFTGGEAFEEDQWTTFSINQVSFKGVKPCARCAIPTTDQDTAIRAAEPLKTLSSFRKWDNKILFGQNVLWMGEGKSVVRVGDLIQL